MGGRALAPFLSRNGRFLRGSLEVRDFAILAPSHQPPNRIAFDRFGETVHDLTALAGGFAPHPR